MSAEAQVAAHLTEEPEETEGSAADSTHPRASETDPIMSSQSQIEREEREDEARSASSGSTNPWKRAPSGPGSSYTLTTSNGLSSSPEGIARGRTGSRSSQTTIQRGASTSDPRRHSGHSASGRPRKPSRTESGRLFLGLPEYRKSQVSLSDQEEASSAEEDEEDEEWVSHVSNTRNMAPDAGTYNVGRQWYAFCTPPAICRAVTEPMVAKMASDQESRQAHPRQDQPIHDGSDVQRFAVHFHRSHSAAPSSAQSGQAFDASYQECRFLLE